MKPLILSSTSVARKSLLGRLNIPFQVVAPNIDETPRLGESPLDLVSRLAINKARAHQASHPDALIIGSDQVALLNSKIVGKPGNHARAVKMLTEASGQTIQFFTGLCLLNTKSQQYQVTIETYQVTYRRLTASMIENYLNKEKPYQCAGSIKVEGLGIALMEELSGKDPSTLTGLPLIALVRMLENEGVFVV